MVSGLDKYSTSMGGGPSFLRVLDTGFASVFVCSHEPSWQRGHLRSVISEGHGGARSRHLFPIGLVCVLVLDVNNSPILDMPLYISPA